MDAMQKLINKDFPGKSGESIWLIYNVVQKQLLLSVVSDFSVTMNYLI